ncbi:MAG: type I restriction enzyme S subunit [Colwellia sp.]|jgi:type I restriction enzyme S subunit
MSLTNQPVLRFPEFKGDWLTTRLGDITQFYKGKGISKAEVAFNGSLKCIRYGELYTHYGEIIKEIKSSTNISKSDAFLSEENDVIIPASGESALDLATASCVKDRGIALGGDINVLRSNIDGTFLSYYLNNVRKKQIARFSQGISVIHLYAKQLKLLKINKPNKDAEAVKLSSFFSEIDTRSSQLEDKLNLIKEYKKAVVQKVFSQELRFKDEDGNDFPQWQEKVLSQVLEIKVRETPKPSENYLALGIRSHMKGTFQKPNFDPEKIMMDKLYIVRPNDLIVNITFAWEGAIAIAKSEDDGGLVSHRFPTYIFKNNESNYQFFRHVIKLERFKYNLGVISPGGAGRNRVLSKKDFLKLKWRFPSIEEQLKIADFLDALDTKIEHVTKQIECTQTFKKGLMQQMFV